MGTIRWTSPGGTTYRFTAPDDATDEQIAAYIEQNVAQMTGGRSDPTEGMSGPERFAAGAGKSVYDTGRGIGQMLGMVEQGDVDTAAQDDAALMRTPGGMFGNVTGHAVQMALPGGAVGKAGMLARAPTLLGRTAQAAAGAGAYGALQPVESGDSRLGNAAFSAAAGALGQVGGEGLAKLAKGGAEMLTPAVKQLAAKAEQYGIPLTSAQLTDSKTVKLLQSVLDKLPFSGAGKRQEGQRAAFNRAVAGTFGENADNLGVDTMARAKSRLGDTFTRLTQNNAAAVDDKLLTELGEITSAAGRDAVPDNAAIVTRLADDILSKTEGGKIAGTAYREMDTRLGRLAKQTTDGDRRFYIGQLRESLREAMDRSVTPMTKKEWDAARRQYRSMKTVEDLAAKSGTGDVSPALLMAKVMKGDKSVAYGGGGELADLARIGQRFLKETIPDSGTAQRMFMQQALSSVGGLGVAAPATRWASTR